MTRALTAAAIAIELLAPFLVVTPRRSRRLGFGLLAGMQLVIALTGNYAYFNLLTIALCLFLLDDDALRHVVGPYRIDATARPDGYAGHLDRRRRRHRARIVRDVCRQPSLVAAASGLVAPIAELIGPFHSVNTYGLFAVMTPTRPEIIVEGSDDGEHWLAYEFKYKPGDLRRRPSWVAPHQPRLDWQMWFAALEGHEQSAWYRGFCVRLLQGSPTSWGCWRRILLQPSAAIRARHVIPVSNDDAATRRATGAWWAREPLGGYSPPISLGSGQ
jgi:hypothetical protein